MKKLTRKAIMTYMRENWRDHVSDGDLNMTSLAEETADILQQSDYDVYGAPDWEIPELIFECASDIYTAYEEGLLT